MRLLLLEDDLVLGEGLQDFLRSEGHALDWFVSIAQVRSLIHEPYDVLLLDWSLPDGSGLDWLSILRRQGNNTPAIMLTARDRLDDRLQGLDGGADDYLIKPFAPEELAARIRVIARRQAGANSPIRRFGAVEVDLGGRLVRLEGQEVELTAREWAVLEALTLRAGRIVPKTELDALVNGFDGEALSNTLEVYVSRLRRKLGKSLIETVRGLGYRLSA